jgi:hypothetical protein
MIQRRQHLRLALQSRHPAAVARKGIREDLEGHLSIQLGVGSAIDCAHAAFPELADDAVVGNRFLRFHRATSGIVSFPGRMTRHSNRASISVNIGSYSLASQQ